MTRVVVVDDHAIVRDSFRGLLADLPDFELVGECEGAELAEAWCARLRPDLVLMDVCAGRRMSGLEATARLTSRFPLLRVIVMTGFEEVTFRDRARRAGASAFVSKSEGMDVFAEVMRVVMGGETWFANADESPVPARIASLTDREFQVFQALCQHRSRREIAAELYISEMTVKRHVASILMKTDFQDSVELAFWAISNGWINPRY